MAGFDGVFNGASSEFFSVVVFDVDGPVTIEAVVFLDCAHLCEPIIPRLWYLGLLMMDFLVLLAVEQAKSISVCLLMYTHV